MILVTGATGNVGGHVVSQLLDRGVAVRALTRDPAAASLPDGVEAVRGDLADPASLDAALDGVETVFLLWPTLAADHAAAAAVERIAGRARRVVYVSARGVSDDLERAPGSILGSHAYLERLIRGAGVEWTFLRPGGFAVNTLLWAPEIRATGVVRRSHGAAGRALIHERDIATVGVLALTEDGHAGAAYELTGPETLTQAEQVAAIGEAIGRPVRWEEVPPENTLRDLVANGMPAAMAESIVAAHNAMVTSPETTTATFEKVTGVPATPFRQWAIDHADDFR
ncbi:NmrA family NAD(P)-binding protein [Streptosporangium sandarakinum]|uniref:NmrA family NAD(P)-binding protein n=1 Tax=Streptosporangium sandarakinum TaxID=1260955 RepID=UPI0033A67A34